MKKPNGIAFPVEADLDFNGGCLEYFEDCIWQNFDRLIDEMLLTNDTCFYFANLFDGIKQDKTIYVEYVWHKSHPLIAVIGYKIFNSNNMPDKVLDRINDFKNGKHDMKTYKFEWK
ncbi:MAG: hypothetical protein WCT77_05845 [Bacteroidota bacterium]|jgi:hypothetical protein